VLRLWRSFLGVHAGEAKHERGVAASTARVAFLAGDAGAESDVSVAGAIDDDLGQQRFPTALLSMMIPATGRHPSRRGEHGNRASGHAALQEHVQRD